MSDQTEIAWRLLRTKTDETVDDTDWAGANDEPDTAISGIMGCSTSDDYPLTAIEFFVLAVDASRVPQDRGTADFDLTVIEVIARDIPSLGGEVGDDPAVVDSAVYADASLNKVYKCSLHGARKFTIRVTNDANLPVGTTQLQIWWRPSSADAG